MTGRDPLEGEWHAQVRTLADRLAALRIEVVPGSMIHGAISDISVELHRIARSLRDEAEAPNPRD